MQQQRRKFLITLFSSVATVCAVAAGVVGYLLINPPSMNPVLAATFDDWKIEYYAAGGTDGQIKTSWIEEVDGEERIYNAGTTADGTVVGLWTFDGEMFNRLGYKFEGWGLDSSSQTVISVYNNGIGVTSVKSEYINTVVDTGRADGVVRLYARWTQKEYTIEFVADVDRGTNEPNKNLGGMFNSDELELGDTNTTFSNPVSGDEDESFFKTATRSGFRYGDEIFAGKNTARMNFEPVWAETAADAQPIFAGWHLDYLAAGALGNDYAVRTMQGTRLITLTDNRTKERGATDRYYPFDSLADDKITLYANYNMGEYKINYFLNAPWSDGITDPTGELGEGVYRGPSWEDRGGGAHSVDPKFPGLYYVQNPANLIAAKQMVPLDAPWTLLMDSPYVIDGYKFVGWYKSDTARGIPGLNANSNPADIFKAGTDAKSGDLDENDSIPGVQVVNLSGSAFSSDADGKTDWQERVDDGRVDLYARWVPIKYYIEYKPGSYGAKTKEDGFGNLVNLTPTAGENNEKIYDTLSVNDLLVNNFYENVGYEFVGWTRYSGSDGDGFIIGANEQISNNSAPNGEGGEQDKVMYVYDSTVPGSNFNANINLSKAEGSTVSLFPVWRKKQYFVKFMLDGGTLTVNGQAAVDDAQRKGLNRTGLNGAYDLNAELPALDFVAISGADGKADPNYQFIGWFTEDVQNDDDDESYIDALIRSMGYQGNGNGFLNFAKAEDGTVLPEVNVNGSLSYFVMSQKLINAQLAAANVGTTAENPIVLYARYIKLRGSIIIQGKVDTISGTYDDFKTGATDMIDPGATIIDGTYSNPDAYNRGHKTEFTYFSLDYKRTFNGKKFQLEGLYYDPYYTDRDTGFIGSYIEYIDGKGIYNALATPMALKMGPNGYFDIDESNGTKKLRKDDVHVEEDGNSILVPGAFVGSVDWDQTKGKWVIPAEFAGASLMLFAKWEPATEVISLRYSWEKGASGGLLVGKMDPLQPTSFEYAVGATVRDKSKTQLKDPTLDGYMFAGWYRDLNTDGILQDTERTAGNIVEVIYPSTEESSFVQLIGTWTPKTYVIRYLNDDDHDNEVLHESAAVTFGVDGESLYAPVRFGYKFNGWFREKADGTRTPLVAYGNVFEPARNEFAYQDVYELYADWTPVDYRVQLIDRLEDETRYYRLDGKLGNSITRNIHTYNMNTPIPGPDVGNDINRPGYIFGGWWWDAEFTDEFNWEFTDNNGAVVSGVPMDQDETTLTDKLDLDGRITLYAKWIPKTIRVEYYNGIDFQPVENTDVFWWLTINPAPVKYEDMAWPETYTYSASGGLSLPRDGIIQSGYIFLDWYVSTQPSHPEGGLILGQSLYVTSVKNDTLSLSAAVIDEMVAAAGDNAVIKLYARWRLQGIPIKYDAESTALIDDKSKLPSQYYIDTTTELPEPTRIGYTFVKWYFESDNINDNGRIELPAWTYVANPEDADPAKGEVVLETLFALWQVEEYNIDLFLQDFNDGNSGISSWPGPEEVTGNGNLRKATIKYKYNAERTLPIPVRTDFEFVGWYENGDGSGNQFSLLSPNQHDFGDVGGNMTKTLYAAWTAKIYDIYYDLNGGANPVGAPQNFTYGVSLTLPTPTRVGYTFNGWHLGSIGGAVISTIASNRSGDITIYAEWTAKTYTISIEVWRDEIGATTQLTGQMLNDIFYTDGTNFSSSRPHVYDTTTQLLNLSKPGYEFAGWFNDRALTSKITNPGDPNALPFIGGTQITENCTIYAKFIWIKYHLMVEHASQTMGEETIYSGSPAVAVGTQPDLFIQYGGSSIGLSGIQFTRYGYNFEGWTLSVTDSDGFPRQLDLAANGNISISSSNSFYYLPRNLSLNDGHSAQGGAAGTGVYGVYTLTSQWSAKVYTLDDESEYPEDISVSTNFPYISHKFGFGADDFTLMPDYTGKSFSKTFGGWFFEDGTKLDFDEVRGRYVLDKYIEYDEHADSNLTLKIHTKWTWTEYTIRYRYVHEYYGTGTGHFSEVVPDTGNWIKTYTLRNNNIALPPVSEIPSMGSLNIGGFMVLNNNGVLESCGSSSIPVYAGGMDIYVKYYTIVEYRYADSVDINRVEPLRDDFAPHEYIFGTSMDLPNNENVFVSEFNHSNGQAEIFEFDPNEQYGEKITLYVYRPNA